MRVFAVETLFGYWVPTPIADLLDQAQRRATMPLIEAFKARVTDGKIKAAATRLKADVTSFRRKGWIADGQSAVELWRERVVRLREDLDHVERRLLPYQRVPEVLDTARRTAIKDALNALSGQLGAKRSHVGVRKVVARFVAGVTTADEFDDELNALTADAAHALSMGST